MWATQTFLKTPEPDAQVFVYYLHVGHFREQVEFTEQMQAYLRRLGHEYGDDVSLLMADRESADKISREVRTCLLALWQELRENLPALLIATVPLEHFDACSGDYAIVSFAGLSASEAASKFIQAKDLIDDILVHKYKVAQAEARNKPSAWRLIWDAMEAKPGIAGFRIDLKKVMNRRW